jgi:hypothetical protein
VLRRIQDLPGAHGWPLLGNTFQVTRERIHLDVEAWAREFGPAFPNSTWAQPTTGGVLP